MARLIGLILLFALHVEVGSAQLIVNTVAGGQIPTGIPAQDALLARVGGIVLDSSGNIVFSESANHVIRRIGLDGTIETVAGTGVSGYNGDGVLAVNATLNHPTGLAYDSAGNLYFTDTGNYRIRRIDTDGIISTVAGTGIPASPGSGDPTIDNQIGQSNSLAIDAGGQLYFSELVLSSAMPPVIWQRIRRLNADGTLEWVAGIDPSTCSPCADGDGGPATAAKISAGAVAFDGAGNLYLADFYHIRRITPDGVIDKFAGYGTDSVEGGPALNALFGPIQSLAVDPTGRIYFAAGPDPFKPPRIRSIASDGTISTLAGGGQSGDGIAINALLNSVAALVGDGTGNVYFADANRVRKLAVDSTVQTIAGGAVKPVPDGTPAADAWLADPTAITVGRNGDLYLFEQSTCSVRRVDANGLLSTAAGTGRCGTVPPSGPVKSTDLPPTVDLVIDSQDQLYGATTNSGVYAISQSGVVAPVAGTTGSSIIAIDSMDRLYVASPYGGVITRIASNAVRESLFWVNSAFSLRGYATAAIGTDTQDNVYVVGHNSSGLNPVVRFDQAGHSSPLGTTFGNSLSTSSPGLSISGDADGTAWFTDGLRIFKYDATTHEQLSKFQGDSGDGGPLESAYFEHPTRIARAPNGDFYVLDQGNYRIRRIGSSH